MKNYAIKYLSSMMLIVGFLLVSGTTFSQTSVLKNDGNNAITKLDVNNWKLIKKVDGVKFYYKSEECHIPSKGMHKEFIILKIENTNSKEVHIEWSNNQWYDNVCRTCGKDEYKYQLKLSANEKTIGECGEYKGGLKMFKRFLNYDDKSELEKFELVNISIK